LGEPAEPGGGPPVDRTVQARPELGRDPLAALAAGDPGPFESFVAAEAPLLLAFFQHLGARRAEAEDLAQDTFLKLFQTADQYCPDGRFRGYAYRVARNAWIDRARRDAYAPRAAEGAGGAALGEADLTALADRGAEEPSARIEAREDAGRLAAAIAALPEAQRLAFELGVVRELPYADVALVLDVPVGTVKSRVFNAVRRLRELLQEGAPARAREGALPSPGDLRP